MSEILSITDRDGDRLIVSDTHDGEPGVQITGRMTSGSASAAYLTPAEISELREALRAHADDDDDTTAAYDDGYADGFAAGVDEGTGLDEAFGIRRKALEAAAETARGLRAASLIGTGPAAAQDVIAYALFLLGELPLPAPADDDE